MLPLRSILTGWFLTRAGKEEIMWKILLWLFFQWGLMLETAAILAHRRLTVKNTTAQLGPVASRSRWMSVVVYAVVNGRCRYCVLPEGSCLPHWHRHGRQSVSKVRSDHFKEQDFSTPLAGTTVSSECWWNSQLVQLSITIITTLCLLYKAAVVKKVLTAWERFGATGAHCCLPLEASSLNSL